MTDRYLVLTIKNDDINFETISKDSLSTQLKRNDNDVVKNLLEHGGYDDDITIIKLTSKYVILVEGYKTLIPPRVGYRKYRQVIQHNNLEQLLIDFSLSDSPYASVLDVGWDKAIKSVDEYGSFITKESVSVLENDEANIIVIDTQFKDEE